MTICLMLALGGQVYAATSVSQFGITWTFDHNYTMGVFANNDPWVVGPVTVIGISPSSTNISGRVKNGSMVNPSGGGETQGYDSSMAISYSAALNKGLNLPLVLPAGSSLVSSISQDGAGVLPQLKTAAILTILASAPPAGSFRPAYCGSDKTIKFNKSNLDYSKLAKLEPTSSTPSLATVERMFERPWLDHTPNWSARYLHPLDNMPDYGREIADNVGVGALILHLNFTDAQKETLLIRFVQLGIDLYGIVANGGEDNWNADGGHASGRKWPILFAGIVLNDSDMKAIGTTTRYKSYLSPYPAFGEDLQTFYISQSDIDLKGHKDADGMAQEDYIPGDLGKPEWGIRHYESPLKDDRAWVSDTKSVYRRCCTATAWGGIALAAHIMNAKTLWNHNAFFDYMDRYMAVEPLQTQDKNNYTCWSAFVCEMWKYRKDYPPVWTDGLATTTTTTPNPPSTSTTTTTVTSSTTTTAASTTTTIDPNIIPYNSNYIMPIEGMPFNLQYLRGKTVNRGIYQIKVEIVKEGGQTSIYERKLTVK